MSDDFDLAHDKLPDQPATIGGDKSAAAWHPGNVPEVPHEPVYYSYEQRQLAEARAERDALAARDAEFVRLAGVYLRASDSERWPQMANKLRALVATTPAASLALHDAEVKAQALDEAKQIVTTVCRDVLSDYYGQVRVEVNAALDRRAAAIRDGAN